LTQLGIRGLLGFALCQCSATLPCRSWKLKTRPTKLNQSPAVREQANGDKESKTKWLHVCIEIENQNCTLEILVCLTVWLLLEDL